MDEAKGERIAKVLARAGVCSRREAERWIASGRVVIDDVAVTTPATFVQPGTVVTVDGKAVAEPERTRLWRYHKPPGLITTHKDTRGRTTVFERLPPEMPRVISIGRLDVNSEGLLLLTNDGHLARKLELPATGWTRRYRVRVYGAVDEAKLASLKRGVTVSGIRYGPIEARIDRKQGANTWLTLSLKEGKNREVKRVMEHLGLTVNRLIRIAYGPFQLGHLRPGDVDELTKRALRESLGKEFAPS